MAGSTQKKRKASIGEIHLNDISTVKENLSSILESVEIFASSENGKFSDLEDIAIIKNTLVQALDVIKNVKELSEEKNNKGLDVKVCEESGISYHFMKHAH